MATTIALELQLLKLEQKCLIEKINKYQNKSERYAW